MSFPANLQCFFPIFLIQNMFLNGSKLKSERSSSRITTKQSSSEQSHRIFEGKRRKFLYFVILIDLFLFAWAMLTDATQYRVAIIGTNDLHGQAFPTVLLRSDSNQQYKYGGLVYLSSMIKTVKEQYNGNIIYLDGGDQFQGGIQSSKFVSSGQIINDFFSHIGLNASSIGNHEFDQGFDFLSAFLKNRPSPNLAANLLSETGQPNFLPNHKASQLFHLPNGIKIGVIGLATIETPSTTAGFVLKKFPPYKFQAYKDIVIKESQALKKSGANAIIIVSHVGNACNSNFTYLIRNEKSSQQKCPPDELSKLIDQLPGGTVHGIVQGHRHRVAHQYHNGIPYMGSINGGYYFNKMQLKFNSRKQLVGSSIQGPIPVCQKIFQHTGRCSYLETEELQNAGQLVNWKFHQKLVTADLGLEEIFNKKYGQKMRNFDQQIVKSEVKLRRKENQESEISNLFTNLLFEAAAQYSPDFALINSGGFRTEWMPGLIQYKHFYNMFPFDNDIQVFELTGEELIQSMKIIQAERRLIQACNLFMEVIIDESNTKKQLRSIRFMNGTQIDKNRVYKGVTLSYLVQGGDQFSKAFGKSFNPKNVFTLGQFRQTLKPYFKKLKVIKKGSLIDPQKPRLVIRRVKGLS